MRKIHREGKETFTIVIFIEEEFWEWIFKLYLILVGWWLLFNIDLISAIHQDELTIGVVMSPPSWASLLSPILSPLLVVIEPQFEFPESYSKFPVAIYFTYGGVYAFMLPSPFISHSPSSPLPWPEVCSLHQHLHCCATSKFISTILLDSIHMR